VESIGIAWLLVKCSILSWRLNVDKDDADVRPNGRLFQVLTAATLEVRSPHTSSVTGAIVRVPAYLIT